MLLRQVKTFGIKPNSTTKEKISYVRKQIKVREIIHTCRPHSYCVQDHLYEDLMEELLATLNDLKLKHQAEVRDPLYFHCIDHPNDSECKVFDL
jgi:hypothetical protein